MKVLSLFDGISCGRIALERAGIPVEAYHASEIEKNAIKVSQRAYPDIVQIGDVTKVSGYDYQDFDMLIGGSPCFVAGTLVTTSDGLKPIEDVKRDERVLTHKNRFRKVVVPMVKSAKGVYNIKIQGSPKTQATAEHPFYVREMYREFDSETRKNVRKWTEPKWVEAKDLLPTKHFVGFAENTESKNPHNISEEEAWLLGRYIADGYTRTGLRSGRKNSYNNQVSFCIGKHKLSSFLENVTEYYAGISEDRTVYKARIISPRLTELALLCGKGAENKEIPSLLMDLPTKLLKCVLDGYMSGDGSYIKNTKVHKASTVSKKLVYSLGQAVQKVYKTPYTISYTVRPKTAVIEGRIVNQRDTYTILFRKEIKKQNNAVYIDGMLWNPVKKVEYDENWEGLVYNFEVEDDNSYVANNATVHNCTDLSVYKLDRGERDGLEGKQSSLFFQYERIFKEMKPKYFLLENVPMAQEWQDVITDILGVEPIRINSNLVSAADRKRLYWTNIPGIEQPEDKGIILRDIAQPAEEVADKYWYDRPFVYNGDDKKVQCTIDISGHRNMKEVYNLNGKSNTLLAYGAGGNRQKKLYQDGRCRKMTPLEYERCQTLPDNYTNSISDSARYSAIGNGWTVDIIAHIFSYIPKSGIQ